MVVTFVHVQERVQDGLRLQNQLKSKGFSTNLKRASNNRGNPSLE
jgi:hypothetical protein